MPDEDLSRPGSLRQLVEQRATSHGSRTFAVLPDATLTFADADEVANRLANVLGERGTRTGDVVAQLAGNGWTALATWFGCAKLGATYLPVNALLTGQPLVSVLSHARAATVVCEAAHLPALAAVLDRLPAVRHVLVTGDREGFVGAVALEPLLDAAPSSPPPALADDPGAPSKLMYTSGTTGTPKGVVWSRACEATHARAYGTELIDLREGESAYCCLPLFHITCQGTTLAALWNGSRITIDAGFQPFAFWDRVRAADAAVFSFVGTILTVLGRRRPKPDDADNPVRRILGAAAPIDTWRAIEERHRLEIVETWGQTETASCWTRPHSMPQAPGSVGRPVEERFEMRVVAPDGGDAAPGQPGEAWLRPKAPHLMFEGYLGPDGVTRESWDEEGWYRTGDLMAWRDDGDLSFKGRLREAVRRRGEMIATSEVEAAALTHPAVAEAAAVGVPDDAGVEQEIKLCATLQPGAALDPAELHRHLAGLLPRFMVPRYVDLRDELPKTPTTRVRKVALSDEGAAGAWDAKRPPPRPTHDTTEHR